MLRQTAIAFTLLTLLVMGNASPFSTKRVDRFVKRVIQCEKIPALGVALVNMDGRKLHVNAYGQSVNTDTRFCLGGATEAFTAVLLAKLLHENENYTWSTPIQNIVGHRVLVSERYRSSHLNLKDILAHRAGYPDLDIVSVTGPYSSDRLTRNLRYIQPSAGFREKYVRNQALFSLLDEVVEKLGGNTWENLIIDHLLRPLKMNSVLFVGDKNRGEATDVAKPVVYYNNATRFLSLETLKNLKIIQQASTLCLSTRDMSRWIRFLLHGNGAEGKPYMDLDVLKSTFVGIQSRGPCDDPEIVGYRQPDAQVSYSREQNALGWITGHYRGDQFVSQDGSIPGVQTLATILPERGAAVYTSFTGKGDGQGLATKTVINMFGLDMLLRGDSWLNEGNACRVIDQLKQMHGDHISKHRNVSRVNHYQGDRSLEDYMGDYRSYAYGTIRVKHNETKDPSPLLVYGDVVFKMEPTNQGDTFQLSAQGLFRYFTDSDEARKKRIIAVFIEDRHDPERRIRDLNITGFGKSGDVVFSKNPQRPYYENFRTQHDCEDAASTSAVSLLMTSLLVFVTIFLR